MKNKVTVIIPTKNPGKIFKDVLTAVCKQKTNFLFKVLVIDSGSSDGTVEYVKSIKDDRVSIFEILPSDFGHGRTRNLAISLTDGDYAALITHDACPATDLWLENLVAAADINARVAGVFGRHIAYSDASPFTKYELEMHFAGFEPLVQLDDAQRYANEEGYRQYLHFFSDNNALVRRSVWEQIPYPDVDFAEDQIWAQKIIEAGWSKAYATDAVVFHSHDYSLVERLQRSFDESYAFYKLFKYQLCPGLKPLLRSWLGITIRDFRLANDQHLWRSEFSAVLRMPIDNFMRLAGHYLGARGDSLSVRLRQFLSRDYRVHINLLKLRQ
jgi:rhamnosyltransferase